MVDFVLDDLGGEAGEGLAPLLEALVLPADLDGSKALDPAHTGEGEAALLGLIGLGFLTITGLNITW